MLFLPVLIIGILLYMNGQRTVSLLIFFFFLFDGFQMFPETWFETGIGFSKSLDFAFLYVIILFIWGYFYYKDFIPHNKISWMIFGYLCMILSLIGISKFIYGISWGDIIKTSRFFFIVLSYFIIRRCTRTEIENVLKISLIILFVQCLLFIIQGFTGFALLAGAEDNLRNSSKVIKRFYNMPKMIFFLLFYVLFSKPFSSKINIIIGVIAVIAIFMPMHRSMIVVVILLLGLGYILRMKNIKHLIKSLPLIALITVPLMILLMAQLSSRTLTDLQGVRNAEFVDTEDIELNEEATFLFRMAHFYERFQFGLTNPMYSLFGMGMMTEESPYTQKKFDFIIGLSNENTGNITQLDTSDISWSLFLIRYGLIGTIIYLGFFAFLCFHYWKIRNEGYSLAIFLFMLLIVGCSLTSSMLFNVIYLIFPFLFYDFSIEDKKNR